MSDYQQDSPTDLPKDSGGGVYPPSDGATTQPPGVTDPASKALAKCHALANSSNILREVTLAMQQLGIVGEEVNTKLLYLIVTTRLFKRPVSVLVKGPSSSGKSVTTQTLLKLFPPEAYYELTSMSDKALIYMDEPVKHRMLAIYEVAGLSEVAQYFVRSLISEGHIKYSVTLKGKGKKGFKSSQVYMEGPTGLIMTTTETYVHPENESRMLSLLAEDSSDQTRKILLAHASDEDRPEFDLEPFHALQTWLSLAEHRVAIPYGSVVAGLIPPTDLRVRRDFPTVLSLIRAHAMLHQLTRAKTPEGVIVASLEDYRVVRELVNEVLSDGLEVAVKPQVRETVEAVRALINSENPRVNVTEVAEYLNLHKTSVLRRVAVATKRGFLVNEEWRPNWPAQLRIGLSLPADVAVLPSFEDVVAGCAVASIPVDTHGGNASVLPQAEEDSGNDAQ